VRIQIRLYQARW